MLAAFSVSQQIELRLLAADHPGTSQKYLMRLALDKNLMVRLTVYFNSSAQLKGEIRKNIYENDLLPLLKKAKNFPPQPANTDAAEYIYFFGSVVKPEKQLKSLAILIALEKFGKRDFRVSSDEEAWKILCFAGPQGYPEVNKRQDELSALFQPRNNLPELKPFCEAVLTLIWLAYEKLR
jgi:hypothetical protein